MTRFFTRLFWALFVLLLGAGAGLLAIAAAGRSTVVNVAQQAQVSRESLKFYA